MAAGIQQAVRVARQQVPAPGEPRTIDLGALDRSIGYVMRRAQLAIFNSFMRTVAAYDIRPAQYGVLIVIGANPGLKQSEVSVALGIHRTNLVAMLDTLEARGLARREPVPTDRRSYALYLTDEGTALLAEIDTLQARQEGRLAAALGEGGREQLLDLLRRLKDAAEEASGEPATADD